MRALLCVVALVLIALQAAAEWGPCATLKRSSSEDSAASSSLYPDDNLSLALDRIIRPVHYALQDDFVKRRNVARAVAADESCFTRVFPFDYSNSSVDTVTLTIYRYKRAVNSTRQMWIVPGGPGEVASSSFSPIGSILAERYEADIYFVDFRGLGTSTPLFYCPDENNRAAFTQSGVPKSRWQACYDEMRTIFGSKLTLFTTSNAARDLNAAILGVRAVSAQAASQELWVAGYSYGTYVVNRFLTLFPNVANGALLDGIIYGPDGSNLFSSYDYNLNLNIDKIMADCLGDAYCRSKITSDSFAAETARKLYSGACPALTDKVSANYTFVFLKYALATQKITTQLIPVALYRLNRCDPKLDAAFISGIAASVQRIIPVAPTQRGTAPKSGLSYFINNFITINEIFDFSKTQEELLTPLRGGSLGQSELLITTFFPLREVVPSYSEPLRTTSFGNTTLTRILFASGAWDANTPQRYADTLFPSVTINAPSDPNAKVHLVIPKSTHIQTLQNPCGAAVSTAFIKRDDTALAAAMASADCQPQPVDYEKVNGYGALIGLGGLNNVWDSATSSAASLFAPITVVLVLFAAIASSLLV